MATIGIGRFQDESLSEGSILRVEELDLLYYFVESTGKPRIDPLLLYLVGGPGCSALNGLFYQTASIVFPDIPDGTSFFYATIPQGYNMSDTISARQTYKFLKKNNDLNPLFGELNDEKRNREASCGGSMVGRAEMVCVANEEV
ncbi:hypothetical protein Fmac_015917 [Flemingia macrophylla]|uniref:Uncharacterized protein n=1 Tax=Flemingia macrophylla TaxID=520843 RepID=A0ABD1MFY1_9FABA